MTISFNRRSFLGSSVAAMTAADSVRQAANAKSSSDSRWRAPGNRERRKLIDMAQFGRKTAVSGKHGAAISTHPLATSAATDMLKMGGTAADAICAASIAQCVVEPHMTTLTGVFSMLYYEAKTGELSYVNGSMNTPKSHPVFQRDLAAFSKILVAGTRNGQLCPVPGYWGGFEAAHARHGRLPIKTVMAPAIHYAREGFEIHPFLWGEMFIETSTLGVHPQGEEMYFRKGRLLNIGETLSQSRHADTLERLAEEGSEYFYRGDFAQHYAAAVQAAGGYVTMEDMEAYKPIWQEPARGVYRGFDLVGSPAPDYGGQSLIEIMNMVELMDIETMGPAYRSPETTLKLMQIIGQVYTDAVTARFTGDIPTVEKSLSKEYAQERYAALTGKPKNPYESLAGGEPAPPGSNHLTVIDSDGNVATVLHSVMSLPYTTKIFVDGVYACAGLVHLASGVPVEDMRTHARICPNMFLKDGKPVLASGSPSVSLTENIVQNSINILDFGDDIETSVHRPRFGGSSMNDFAKLMVEKDMGEATRDMLRENGAGIEITSPWSWAMGSFEGIAIAEDGTATACGDPRRTAQAFAV